MLFIKSIFYNYKKKKKMRKKKVMRNKKDTTTQSSRLREVGHGFCLGLFPRRDVLQHPFQHQHVREHFVGVIVVLADVIPVAQRTALGLSPPFGRMVKPQRCFCHHVVVNGNSPREVAVEEGNSGSSLFLWNPREVWRLLRHLLLKAVDDAVLHLLLLLLHSSECAKVLGRHLSRNVGTCECK